MRNNRFTAILIAVILVLLSFSGCDQGTKYAPYTALRVATEGNAAWPEPNIIGFEYLGPSEVSVTVNGVTYTGTYADSSISMPFYYDIDHEFRGDGFEFHIREGNGKLVELTVEVAEPSGEALDASRLRQIADSIADDYIPLKKSKVEISESKYNDEVLFRYYRTVQEHVTAEWVLVRLNSSGDLTALILSAPDAFENVKRIHIDENKAEKVLDEKLNEIDKEIVLNGGETSYRIENKEIIMTVNNQCALLYDIVHRYGTGGFHVTERFYMLVIVDHEKYNPFKP